MADEKVTDSSGTTWRKTQGGNWRAENGPKKGQLYKGKGSPAAGAAAAPAPTAKPEDSGTQTIAKTPPPNFSPQGQAYLSGVQSDLSGQVASGGINQLQADQELARRQAEVAKYSPGLQSSQWDLYNQVKSGGINQDTADNELYRLWTNQQTTQPDAPADIKLDTFKDVVDSTYDVSKGGTVAGNTLTNPNQISDLGKSTVEYDPVTGQPIVKQELSQGNRDVLGGLQQGSVGASNTLNSILSGGVLGSLTNPGQGVPQSNFESAVYNQLTRGFDTDKGQQAQQLTQTLANRGIPVGSSAYESEMKRFEDTWGQRYDAARNSAVTGANTAAQSAIPMLSSVGQSGFYAPNFQGFTPTQYNQLDVGGVFNTLTGKQIADDANKTELEKQKISLDASKAIGGGGGGGGGAAPPKVSSPFNSKAPGA